jgi:hypothetical protein
MKVLGTVLLLVGLAGMLSAQGAFCPYPNGCANSIPEITADSAGTAVVLLSGALLVLKCRRKR